MPTNSQLPQIPLYQAEQDAREHRIAITNYSGLVIRDFPNLTTETLHDLGINRTQRLVDYWQTHDVSDAQQAEI